MAIANLSYQIKLNMVNLSTSYRVNNPITIMIDNI